MNALVSIIAVCLVLGLIVYLLIRLCFARSMGKPVDPRMSLRYVHGKFNSNKIYYAKGEYDLADMRALIGVDVASLKIMSSSYAKDKHRVYFQNEPIDVDPASFYLDEQGVPKDFRNVYVIHIHPDGHASAQIIEDAAPVTYKKLHDHVHWGKDHAHYYYKDKKVDVDSESFVFLSPFWAKDKARVYRLCEQGPQIVNADVDTFKLMNDNFAQDRQSVFFSGNMPGEEDPKGFQLNSFNYEPDATLEFLSEYHIRHNNKIYYCGLITDIESSSFQTFLSHGKLFHGFSKDSLYVYKYNKKLRHIDAPSFRVSNDVMRDKYNRYDAEGDIFGSPFQG